jgi:hypothetical protein
MIFVIEDDQHCELGASFATEREALAELERLAALPWDAPPNQAPCTGWENCGRRYALVEYDDSGTRWRQTRHTAMLEISAQGIYWLAPGPRA